MTRTETMCAATFPSCAALPARQCTSRGCSRLSGARALDYPPPIVDVTEGNARFLRARGRDDRAASLARRAQVGDGSDHDIVVVGA
jgi:hypothetical protein